MRGKGLWVVFSCALAVNVVQCDAEDRSAKGSKPEGGEGGNGEGGSSGNGALAGEDAGGSGDGVSSGRGGSSGQGGSSGRGGSSGAPQPGGAAGLGGDSGAGQGGEAGGSGAGDSGAGGGDSMGGETGGGGKAGGGGEGGEDGPSCEDPPPVGPCTNDLSYVGTGDFEVKFTITTSSQQASAAVLSQRGVCDHSYFWAVRFAYGGRLWLELDDPEGRNHLFCLSAIPVNDGVPHRVVMRRISGVVSIVVDCREPDFCSSATDLSAALPPLGGPAADPCIWEPGYMAIDGTVSRVCARPL